MGRKWCQYKFSNYIRYSAFGSCYQVKLPLYGNPTSSWRNSVDENIELVFTVLTLSMHLIGLAEQRRNSVNNFYWKAFNPGAAGFIKAGLRKPRFTTKFEFRYKSLKGKFSSILSVHYLMIGYSKNNRENCPRKCFWIKEKEAGIKIYPRLSCYRPSINLCIPNRTSPLFKDCCPTFVKKQKNKNKNKKNRSFPSNLCGLPGVRKGITKYVKEWMVCAGDVVSKNWT